MLLVVKVPEDVSTEEPEDVGTDDTLELAEPVAELDDVVLVLAEGRTDDLHHGTDVLPSLADPDPDPDPAECEVKVEDGDDGLDHDGLDEPELDHDGLDDEDDDHGTRVLEELEPSPEPVLDTVEREPCSNELETDNEGRYDD